MWHSRKGERAKETKGKKKKREKRGKKKAKGKEKPRGGKKSNGKAQRRCEVRGALRAGEGLWGLPPPRTAGHAARSPLLAAASQVMFIALK